MAISKKTPPTVFIADHRFRAPSKEKPFDLVGMSIRQIEEAAAALPLTIEVLDYPDNATLLGNLSKGGLALIHAEKRDELIQSIKEHIHRPLIVVFFTTRAGGIPFLHHADEVSADGDLILLFQRNLHAWRSPSLLAGILGLGHREALEIARGTTSFSKRPGLFVPADNDPVLDDIGFYLHNLLSGRATQPYTLERIAASKRLDIKLLPEKLEKPGQYQALSRTIFPANIAQDLKPAIDALGAANSKKRVLIWNQGLLKADSSNADDRPAPNTALPDDNVICSLHAFKNSPLYKSAALSYREATLIILVELDWGGAFPSQGLGFQILHELVDRGFRGDVIFFSVFPRAKLVETSLQPYAKIFPTVLLQDTKIDFAALKVPRFSAHKWELVCKYYLHKHGFLETVLHDLGNLTLPGRATADALDLLHKNLMIHAAQLSGEILAAIEQFKLLDRPSDQDRKEHVLHLIDCTNQYKAALKAQIDPSFVPPRDSLLLVEDDISFAEQMIKGLEHEFVDIQHFSDAASAIQALRRNPKQYAALLLDMEMVQKDTQYWQAVQGIDVLEYAANLPWMVIVGLSSLTRMAIGTSPAFDAIRVIPKSFETETRLPAHIGYQDLAKDIYAMIERKRELRLAGCPNKGPWITDGLMVFYLALRYANQLDDLLAEVMQTVQALLDGKLADQPIPAMLSFSKLAPDTGNRHSEPYLQKILAHRLLHIHFQNKNGYVSHQEIATLIQGGKDSAPAVNEPVQIAYFSTHLGFGMGPLHRGHKTIVLENLLDHERTWLDQAAFDAHTAFNLLVQTLKSKVAEAVAIDPGYMEMFPMEFLTCEEPIQSMTYIEEAWTAAQTDWQKANIAMELYEAGVACPLAYQSLQINTLDDEVAAKFDQWKAIEAVYIEELGDERDDEDD